MSESTAEKIDRLRLYNRTMIAAAFTKANRRHQGLPAKLMLCSLFDSLSIAAFPAENGVGNRYRQTLSKHADWPAQGRISLLPLCGVLDREKPVPADFAALDHWARSELNKRFPSSSRLVSTHYNLERDPDLSELLAQWPTEAGGCAGSA